MDGQSIRLPCTSHLPSSLHSYFSFRAAIGQQQQQPQQQQQQPIGHRFDNDDRPLRESCIGGDSAGTTTESGVTFSTRDSFGQKALLNRRVRQTHHRSVIGNYFEVDVEVRSSMPMRSHAVA
jgi:hypothetical protein